jgi:hypothetical protein
VQLMRDFGAKPISSTADLEAALELIYRGQGGEIFRDLQLRRTEIYETALPHLPFPFTKLVYSVSHSGEVRGAGVKPLRGGTPPYPLHPSLQ